MVARKQPSMRGADAGFGGPISIAKAAYAAPVPLISPALACTERSHINQRALPTSLGRYRQSRERASQRPSQNEMRQVTNAAGSLCDTPSSALAPNLPQLSRVLSGTVHIHHLFEGKLCDQLPHVKVTETLETKRCIVRHDGRVQSQGATRRTSSRFPHV